MGSASTPMSPSRALRAEAAAWLAKLHGPERTPALEADFHSWISSNAENARAFEHITEIWESINPATAAGLPRTAVAPAQDERRKRPRMGLAAATCAVAAVTSGLLWFFSGEHYTTQIGEQRIITLSDGSRLTLNSGTRVDVRLDKSLRRIFLKRGEAYFEVVKDPTRPFVVTAGNDTVTAVGTTFLVRYDPAATAVTLVEGKVTVAPAIESSPPGEARSLRSTDHLPSSAGKGPENSTGVAGRSSAVGDVFTLAPGQRLTITSSGTATLDTPKPESTAAWRHGEVILDNTPLQAAAAEMNRYERHSVVIDDPQVAKLLVSGIYKTGDSEDFAQAVAKVYDLQVEHEGNEIHIRHK